MSAEDYRRKARHYLAIALQMSRPEDRIAMIGLSALWMERAEQAEQGKRVVQQQQQTQPEKEPEGERS